MNILSNLEKKIIPPLEELFNFILNHKIPINRHPLGFYCCKLIQNKNISIRLHFWLKENQKQKNFEIHNHIFDLESYILIGAIQNIIYEPSLEKEGIPFNTFITSYNNEKSTITLKDSNIFLKVKERNTYLKSQKYTLTSNIIHQSNVMSEKAITLMYTLNTNNTVSPIVYSKVQVEKLKFYRSYLTDSEKLELINYFLE